MLKKNGFADLNVLIAHVLNPRGEFSLQIICFHHSQRGRLCNFAEGSMSNMYDLALSAAKTPRGSFSRRRAVDCLIKRMHTGTFSSTMYPNICYSLSHFYLLIYLNHMQGQLQSTQATKCDRNFIKWAALFLPIPCKKRSRLCVSVNEWIFSACAVVSNHVPVLLALGIFLQSNIGRTCLGTIKCSLWPPSACANKPRHPRMQSSLWGCP